MKHSILIILVLSSAILFNCADSDYQSPDLDYIVVTEITDTTARISWNTDEPATGILDYGLTTSYGLTVELTEPATVQSVVLEDLKPGGLYYFRIKVTDDNDNTTTSAKYDFTTTDSVPPVLSNLAWTEGADQIELSWDVDEQVTTRLDYGLTDEYGSFLTDDELKESFQFLVETLDSATIYHFQITLTDQSDNVFVSEDFSIGTLSL